MKNVKEEKDIGMTFNEYLMFEKHITEKVKKKAMCGMMLRRTFIYRLSSIFVPLYKTMVRSHLDYVSSVWSPYLRKHI